MSEYNVSKDFDELGQMINAAKAAGPIGMIGKKKTPTNEEKIEELRKSLSSDIEWISKQALKSVEYRIGFCAANENVTRKLNSLFPPAKKGAWCFWATNELGVRTLYSRDSREELNKVLLTHFRWSGSPSEPFFLEEK